jgi:hypothetical protein
MTSLFDDLEEKPVVKLVPTRIRFALDEPRCVLRLLGVTPDERERTWNDVRRKQAVKKFTTLKRHQNMANQTTTTAPKSTAMPPSDTNGETDKALSLLKRLRTAVSAYKDELSPEWIAWVLSSFNKGLNTTQKTLIPDEQDTPEKKA